MQKGDVVNAGGEVREEVADPLAALPVLLEFPLRPDNAPLVFVPAATECLPRNRLAIEGIEFWFVVKGLYGARPAIAEDEDDALRLRLEVWFLRCQRIDELADTVGGDGLPREEVC